MLSLLLVAAVGKVAAAVGVFLLYAALEIPEYWVVDIRGERVLAFRLQDDGKYQQCEYSVALEGLPISLIEQTLRQLEGGNNGSAALWFALQIPNL